MTKEIAKKQIAEIFNAMDEDSIVMAWNKSETVKSNYYFDNGLYRTEDFSIFMNECTPFEIADLICSSEHFDIKDKYFWFSAEDKIHTGDWNDCINVSAIVDNCIWYDDDCGNADIRAILNEIE